jgi:hypothetical protein
MGNPSDRKILRDLAMKVADISKDPVMSERRELWKKHNSLQRVRPMILLFPEGSWRELLSEASLACETKENRTWEADLRRRIYYHEHFADDTVIENRLVVQKAVTSTGWGLEPKTHPSTDPTGAWGFDPVVLERSDLKKLHMPEISIDEAETQRRLAVAQDVFGDILDVQLIGVAHVSFHLMSLYARLRGLEQTMLDMYENPDMLNEAMMFYEVAHRGLLAQYVELNLLSLNNNNTYHSSGGNGWTNELPAKGYDSERIRPCDMWASAESQEMAQVSPVMHEEFVLQYERRLLEPFGLAGYGCCEALTRKLDYVMKAPNMRRVSISPWADVDACAEKLKGKYIFSWKPHPAHLTGEFNAKAIREYILHTVRAAKANGCVLEMILKDTHTCENHAERFDNWAKIARQVVEAEA